MTHLYFAFDGKRVHLVIDKKDPKAGDTMIWDERGEFKRRPNFTRRWPACGARTAKWQLFPWKEEKERRCVRVSVDQLLLVLGDAQPKRSKKAGLPLSDTRRLACSEIDTLSAKTCPRISGCDMRKIAPEESARGPALARFLSMLVAGDDEWLLRAKKRAEKARDDAAGQASLPFLKAAAKALEVLQRTALDSNWKNWMSTGTLVIDAEVLTDEERKDADAFAHAEQWGALCVQGRKEHFQDHAESSSASSAPSRKAQGTEETVRFVAKFRASSSRGAQKDKGAENAMRECVLDEDDKAATECRVQPLVEARCAHIGAELEVLQAKVDKECEDKFELPLREFSQVGWRALSQSLVRQSELAALLVLQSLAQEAPEGAAFRVGGPSPLVGLWRAILDIGADMASTENLRQATEIARTWMQKGVCESVIHAADSRVPVGDLALEAFTFREWSVILAGAGQFVGADEDESQTEESKVRTAWEAQQTLLLVHQWNSAKPSGRLRPGAALACVLARGQLLELTRRIGVDREAALHTALEQGAITQTERDAVSAALAKEDRKLRLDLFLSAPLEEADTEVLSEEELENVESLVPQVRLVSTHVLVKSERDWFTAVKELRVQWGAAVKEMNAQTRVAIPAFATAGAPRPCVAFFELCAWFGGLMTLAKDAPRSAAAVAKLRANFVMLLKTTALDFLAAFFSVAEGTWLLAADATVESLSRAPQLVAFLVVLVSENPRVATTASDKTLLSTEWRAIVVQLEDAHFGNETLKAALLTTKTKEAWLNALRVFLQALAVPAIDLVEAADAEPSAASSKTLAQARAAISTDDRAVECT